MMRTPIGLILLLMVSPAISQIQTNLKFLGNCPGEVVMLEYELSNQDTSVTSNIGKAQIKIEGFYLLSTGHCSGRVDLLF